MPATAKFQVRYGSHFEPDLTDTTYKEEKRPRREREFKAGEVFESTVDRVKQHGEKFVRVSEHAPVSDKPIYVDGSEALDIVDETPQASLAVADQLTEQQMKTMPAPELIAHCKKVGIDTKGTTDRNKLIQLILEDQSA